MPPFQKFLDAHRAPVLRFLVASVGRDEADDCFQETFIAALRAYPRLRDASNLRAWVLTIAHRKALDAHRARGRRPVAAADDLEATATGAAVALARPLAERGRRRGAVLEGAPPPGAQDGGLWAEVRRLPPRQRQAIGLRYAGDLAYRDVAAAMGCSEEAARRSVHEGLSKLRKVVL